MAGATRVPLPVVVALLLVLALTGSTVLPMTGAGLLGGAEDLAALAVAAADTETPTQILEAMIKDFLKAPMERTVLTTRLPKLHIFRMATTVEEHPPQRS